MDNIQPTRDVTLADLGQMLDVPHLEFMAKSLRQYNETVYAIIIPYKNARVDMEILDSVVGRENWQNEYRRDSKGILQCGIGIWSKVREEWIWKWSNGVPSNFEKEKGEYSDAFKRAGYMWGIGRCLYNFPPIKVQLNDREWKEKAGGGVQATGFLKPDAWEWDIWIDFQENCYEQVVVADKAGNVLFNLEPHKKKYKNLENKQNAL